MGIEGDLPPRRPWSKVAVVVTSLVVAPLSWIGAILGDWTWTGCSFGCENGPDPQPGWTVAFWGVTALLVVAAPLFAWWRLRRWQWVAGAGALVGLGWAVIFIWIAFVN